MFNLVPYKLFVEFFLVARLTTKTAWIRFRPLWTLRSLTGNARSLDRQLEVHVIALLAPVSVQKRLHFVPWCTLRYLASNARVLCQQRPLFLITTWAKILVLLRFLLRFVPRWSLRLLTFTAPFVLRLSFRWAITTSASVPFVPFFLCLQHFTLSTRSAQRLRFHLERAF